MTNLPDMIPMSRKQARVWAESLIGDLTYEEALAVAQALLEATSPSCRDLWPISARNAQVMHDALVTVAESGAIERRLYPPTAASTADTYDP